MSERISLQPTNAFRCENAEWRKHIPREPNQPMRRMTVEFIADYPATGKRKGEKATMPQGAALILISSGYAKEVPVVR